MTIRLDAINELATKLGPDFAAGAVRTANQVDRLESEWRRKMKRYYDSLLDEVLRQLTERGAISEDTFKFEDILTEQSFEVTEAGLRSAGVEAKALRVSNIHRLGAPPKGRLPRTLRDLMKLWDQWRRKKVIPPRQQFLAHRIRKAYINKVESVWRRHSEDFREGRSFNQDKARQYIKKASDASFARAKMIVETETTHYYNKARRNIYDESPDVTHYLFMAIRDHATTKWCKTRTGLVYVKGDPMLETETPPIHWNCRSELLPLTLHNPKHRLLIEDKSKQRRNHRCEPLPAGWNRR